MPRYRFPGRLTAVPAFCKPKERKPFTIIKVCPPQPYIKDFACRPNIYDRAIVRTIDPCCKTVALEPDCRRVCKPREPCKDPCKDPCRDPCKDPCRVCCNPEPKCEVVCEPRCETVCRPRFVLETFSNSLILCPINLDRFCGYDFKEGDVVAVEAEDMSGVPCQGDICEIAGSIPVKLFNIKRTWKLEIRQLRGIVQAVVDNNGIGYHMVTEVTDLTAGDPTFRETENSLLFAPIVINYEIVNIMGQEDAEATMRNLEGKIISAVYVDYGTETSDRVGLPIVITDFTIVG